jgi:transglutaminase-like putative cysteine protease
MTTHTTNSVRPVSVWRRRFGNAWRMLFAPGDLMALFCAIGLLLMAVMALHDGGWPLLLNVLVAVIIVSVLLGFALARSHYNELFALVVSGFAGFVIVFMIAGFSEPGGLILGTLNVIERVAQWLVDVFTGGINQDPVVFTLLVALLFWFLGYNAAWHMFRVDRVWRVILPPGLIIISNTIFYVGPNQIEIYLVIFIFLSLLLVVRSHLDAREWDWYVNGIRVPSNLRRQFLQVGTVLSLIVLLTAWNLPIGDIEERLTRFQEFLQSEPLQQMSELWNRVFASVDTQGPVTADYYGGDSLELSGAIQLGEQIVFWVSAPQIGHRYYWRSRVFDTYEAGRWLPAVDTRLSDPDGTMDLNMGQYGGAARQEIEEVFTMGLNTSRLLYAAPQPLRFNLPARADLRETTDDTMNVSVVRPMNVLYRGDSYTASSLISIATADQLRSASSSYDQWIRDLYLYVSPSVTEATRALAQQIVTEAGAVTPYDQAKAIERWLRRNIIYNETIPQPPPDRDPVDWVLFDLRQGYCNYYASAMIVMLRTLGVPARMAAGFAEGTWDAAQQVYVVEERDAHTWVEVYFPGYGWIEFEPTAAQAPLERDGDAEQNQPELPTSTPNATPTYTPTPSPEPSPTNVTPTPPNAAEIMPSPTPTYTPSPTQTPVIVPTQPPPVRQQPRGLLAFLLPALGVVLAVVLVVGLILGILTLVWWWWEWRGMKGLSPIARAYARLERYLTLIGLRLGEQQTPEERRRKIIKELPQAAEPPVTAITRLYSAERYGPKKAPKEQSEIADRAWVDTRGNILKRWLRKFIPFAGKKK